MCVLCRPVEFAAELAVQEFEQHLIFPGEVFLLRGDHLSIRSPIGYHGAFEIMECAGGVMAAITPEGSTLPAPSSGGAVYLAVVPCAGASAEEPAKEFDDEHAHRYPHANEPESHEVLESRG